MICEKCGKEHDGSFGSGRFCSRSCANSRVRPEEIKLKISNSVKQTFLNNPTIREQITDSYKKTIKIRRLKQGIVNREKEFICSYCGKPFKQIIDKKSKFCSESCRENSRRLKASKQINHGAGCKGKYKEIQCDSKLELIFLVYCLDHNIKIKRCKDIFEYEFRGKKHLYNPDFIINNKVYIEIKGWDCKVNDIKLQAVRSCNRIIHILYAQDLKKCLTYVKSKYQIKENSFEVLYDPKEYEKTCIICGKKFLTRNKKQKTCSRKCNGKNTSNRFWIRKDLKVKHIKELELQSYLEGGWKEVKPIPGKSSKDWKEI